MFKSTLAMSYHVKNNVCAKRLEAKRAKLVAARNLALSDEKKARKGLATFAKMGLAKS